MLLLQLVYPHLNVITVWYTHILLLLLPTLNKCIIHYSVVYLHLNVITVFLPTFKCHYSLVYLHLNVITVWSTYI